MYLVVGFCKLMFLSAMVVALMLITEHRERTLVSSMNISSSILTERILVPATGEEDVARPAFCMAVLMFSPQVCSVSLSVPAQSTLGLCAFAIPF